MRLVVMLLLGFVLGGCGSKGPQPVKLVDFKPSAKLGFAWKVNIGDAGRYIFTPAISGDSVFAAGNRGDLLRINAANGKTLWRGETHAPPSGGGGRGGKQVLGGKTKGGGVAFGTDRQP